MSGALSREEVADRLHSAAIHLLRLVRTEDAATGLSPSRLSALSVVVFAGPLTVGELAAAEQVRSPTMSGLVTGLEGEGLVERVLDPNDARASLVRATAKGRRLLNRARAARLAALQAVFSDLSDRDVAAVGRTVTVLERAIASAAAPTSGGRGRRRGSSPA